MSASSSSGSGGGNRGYAYREPSTPPMGKGWTTNFIARLKLDDSALNSDFVPIAAHLSFGDGRYRTFNLNGINQWVPKGTHQDILTATHPDGVVNGNSTFTYQAVDSDQKLVFKLYFDGTEIPLDIHYQGLLSKIVERNGWTTHIEIDPTSPPDALRPLQVTNQFGRQLRFSYTHSGQISAATSFAAGGQQVAQATYTYDAEERLTRVTYPNRDYRDFHYEDPNNTNWLTGYSTNGHRIDTYNYDEIGRAVETIKTGNVERYYVDYSQGTINIAAGIYSSAKVIDPINTERAYSYRAEGGRVNVGTSSLVGSDASSPPVKQRGINARGLVTSEYSFANRPISSTTYDARHLPTEIREGSALKTRTITWHPDFRLPTEIVEGDGTRTVNTYDAHGNLTQRDVTKAGDVSSNRTWNYTYNAAGLLETETDPRGGVSTYAYNTLGQLIRSRNQRNHTTTYGYDAAGRVNRITQPNGLIQRFAYNPRGWITRQTQTAGGATLTSNYTYEPSGQVKTASLPNGHVITYQYDAAERLVGWSDNRSQSATYTLDPMGNAIDTVVRNSNGQTALRIQTEINAINRVQSQTVGGSIIERQTQDANGKLATVSNAANQTTTLARDPLDRVTTITNAAAKTARLAYDAQDSVTAATDFKGVKTTFTRDAQGNAKTEASPDIGTTTAYYNGLELPTSVTDAMGRASAITRDAIGRPTRIVHTQAGQPTLTTLLTYDTGGDACNAPGHTMASNGQLCTMVDKVGNAVHATTQYQWDSFGRLTAQTQTLSSAIADHSVVQTTAFSYVASGAGAGQLASLTYPSGSVLTHSFDATGRLNAMALDGQPLLSEIKYDALEQPLSWTWSFATPANSLKANRVYNTAGQLTNAGFTLYTPNNLGQIVDIKQALFRQDSNGGWTNAWTPFTASYDALGQLTAFNANDATEPSLQYGYTYQYDANGNRNGGEIALGGTSAGYTSAVPTTNNRPTTFSGISAVTNAAGDVTSLLGKTIAYDAAGRVSQVTAIPPCPSGLNCSGSQTTLSRYNGHNQRYLRENPDGQSVFTYAPDGYSVLAEVNQTLVGATTASNTTETVYLPTASGPMPVVALINGEPFAVYTDHLNTPRRLTDAQGRPRWQWAFSGFGEQAAQSIPRTGLPTVSYSLRYPGQVDDGNGLFYNFNRFYDPLVGRYTNADPIGLDGGWNRFGYVGGNPLGFTDPKGLQRGPVSPSTGGPANSRGPDICTGPNCSSPPFDPSPDGPVPAPNLPNLPRQPNTQCHPFIEWCFGGCTCSDTSTNGAACLSCCVTVTGALRSGTGTVCQQQCVDKFPGLIPGLQGGSK